MKSQKKNKKLENHHMLILKKKNYLEAQPSEVCKEKRKKTKESQRKCQHFLWTCVLGSFPILTKVKGGKCSNPQKLCLS